ncbi:MAG: hypothetical protein JWM11_3986, partial [Planctomycetaceae bacterium]|nr:hypothetical protein [Planctomycetaceae bacterium]
EPFGFISLNLFRLAFGNGAKPAGPRANIPQDHESGGFLRPALGLIGTLGAFADGFQLQFCDQIAGKRHARLRHGPFEPRW